jgi:ATP-binding cassette subfamily B multidrug efflux pump
VNQRALVWRWAKIAWAGRGVWLAGIVALSVVNAVLSAGFPWFWQILVDDAQASASPVRLRQVAGWMGAVGVGQFVVYVGLQGMRTLVNAAIQRRVRQGVFEHLATLDPGFYERWRTGDLVTRLTDDAGEKISWFLCSGVFRTLEASLVVIACLSSAVIVAPRVAFWMVLPLPLLIVAQAFAQGALGRRYGEVQAAISRINDELSATFGGIRIVQAAGLQASARSRFVGAAEAQQQAEVRTAAVQHVVHLMYGYGWQMAVVALLLAGGHQAMSGAITLGQFVTLEGLVMTMVWPMFDVGTFLSRYQQAGVALVRLQALADEVPGADGPPRGAALAEAAGLPPGPGRMVAVVGEVASGKSTLMQALARTGGGDGYVPQDPMLMSATVRENILLGREVSEDELDAALDVSRLAQDLPDLPDGIDTVVGERGVTLSGGQQQRVALARALVGRPPLLLLDDATAALDADTEAAFWRRLDDVLPDVAAVVVTHRGATLQAADEILVLDGGAIVQRGGHGELIEQEGAYRRIYGRFEAEERVRGVSRGS